MVIFLIFGGLTYGEQKNAPTFVKSSSNLTIVRSQMCESVNNHEPVNPTVALSVDKEKAFCFTVIENIEKSSYVYHNWIRQDKTVTRVKLLIKPPRWSTFSSIALRDIDKGPWRVEVTDMEGNTIKTLRFSVVD